MSNIRTMRLESVIDVVTDSCIWSMTLSLEDGAWNWDEVDSDLLTVVLVADLEEWVTWSGLEDALLHGGASESVVGVDVADISLPVDVDQGGSGLN